jgi:hypothetical protein
LRINRENAESQAARHKIIRAYFSGSNTNPMPFIDTKTNILLHAILWMTRDDAIGGHDRTADGMSLMYPFFHSFAPSQCCLRGLKMDKTIWLT